MSARAWLLGLLVLSAGLAGCIGDGEGEETETSASDDPIDADANETDGGADEADASRTWTNETFEGQISGFNILVLSGTNGDAMQTFTAETGIDVLFLNLTAEGGAVDMTIGDPDCDVSGNQIPPCAETTSTSGGEASYVNETPTSGEWQVRLAVGDPVGAQVSYTLNAVQGINATAEQ